MFWLVVVTTFAVIGLAILTDHLREIEGLKQNYDLAIKKLQTAHS